MFLSQLERIEYQASRIAENCDFERVSDRQSLAIKQKSCQLLVGVIEFFNNALSYFGQSFGRILGIEIITNAKKWYQTSY